LYLRNIEGGKTYRKSQELSRRAYSGGRTASASCLEEKGGISSDEVPQGKKGVFWDIREGGKITSVKVQSTPPSKEGRQEEQTLRKTKGIRGRI